MTTRQAWSVCQARLWRFDMLALAPIQTLFPTLFSRPVSFSQREWPRTSAPKITKDYATGKVDIAVAASHRIGGW